MIDAALFTLMGCVYMEIGLARKDWRAAVFYLAMCLVLWATAALLLAAEIR